jgi:hypothetical protein
MIFWSFGIWLRIVSARRGDDDVAERLHLGELLM